MLAAKSSSATTGVYSSSRRPRRASPATCGGAMPSSISISARRRARGGGSRRAPTPRRTGCGWPTPTSTPPGRRRVEQPVEQRLVAGVDLGLRRVRRRRPPAELGVDELHRQVGALDEADLDRCATAAMAVGCPRQEVVERRRACRGGRPARRCRRAGRGTAVSSSTRRKAATVRWRSRYSSMSRLTNTGGRWRRGDVVDRAQPVGDAVDLVRRTPARRGRRTAPRSSPRRSRRRADGCARTGRRAVPSPRRRRGSPRREG